MFTEVFRGCSSLTKFLVFPLEFLINVLGLLVWDLWIFDAAFQVLVEFEQFRAELGVVCLENLPKLGEGYVRLWLQDKIILLVLGC